MPSSRMRDVYGENNGASPVALHVPVMLKRRRNNNNGSIQKNGLLLCTLLVCASNRGKSNVAAYLTPTSSPFQSRRYFCENHGLFRGSSKYATRPRLTHTKINESSTINGLAVHDNKHSDSIFNVGYDAESIIDYYDRRPWEIGLRLNMLGLPLLGMFKFILFSCNFLWSTLSIHNLMITSCA